jgi:nitrogen fixation protein FixH
MLTIAVGAFIAYLGYELVTFAREPELRITDPPTNVSAYTETTMTVRGETEPNAQVMVSNLTENPTVTADADGHFEVIVELLPGSNVIELQARDGTTNRDSEVQRRTVVVVDDVAGSPSPPAVAIGLDQPAADASLTGPVPVSGSAAPAAQISAAATPVTPATPNFAVLDASGTAVTLQPVAPVAPEALAITADPAGAFSGSLPLAPGTWDVTLAAAGADSVTRRVNVQPGAGLTGMLQLVDGESYLEIEIDGTPLAGISGGIIAAGQTIELSAQRDMRIRAGNAGAVRITLNGINIGAMGGNGAVVEWRIAGSGG